jgi:hypothetical protein
MYKWAYADDLGADRALSLRKMPELEMLYCSRLDFNSLSRLNHPITELCRSLFIYGDR